MLPRLREEAAGLSAAQTAAPGPSGTSDDPRQRAADVARDAKHELGSGFLQSLARGLAVLRALEDARDAGLPVTAIAQSTGLPRTTVHRCLLTLLNEGYAARAGHLFRPLPRVLELGYASLSALTFSDIVQPHLRDLVTRVKESASVTVLDGTDILYVARVPIARVMSVDITVGTRFPAYATAMGRVLLAGLPEREREHLLAADGHALIDQELEEGLRSVAVPLRNAHGRVIAALNVAQHSGEAPLTETGDALLPALRRTAAAIEADLATAARFHTLRVP